MYLFSKVNVFLSTNPKPYSAASPSCRRSFWTYEHAANQRPNRSPRRQTVRLWEAICLTLKGGAGDVMPLARDDWLTRVLGSLAVPTGIMLCSGMHVQHPRPPVHHPSKSPLHHLWGVRVTPHQGLMSPC